MRPRCGSRWPTEIRQQRASAIDNAFFNQLVTKHHRAFRHRKAHSARARLETGSSGAIARLLPLRFRPDHPYRSRYKGSLRVPGTPVISQLSPKANGCRKTFRRRPPASGKLVTKDPARGRSASQRGRRHFPAAACHMPSAGDSTLE